MKTENQFILFIVCILIGFGCISYNTYNEQLTRDKEKFTQSTCGKVIEVDKLYPNDVEETYVYYQYNIGNKTYFNRQRYGVGIGFATSIKAGDTIDVFYNPNDFSDSSIIMGSDYHSSLFLIGILIALLLLLLVYNKTKEKYFSHR